MNHREAIGRKGMAKRARAARLADPRAVTRRAGWMGTAAIVMVCLALVGVLFRVYRLQTRPPAKIAALVDSQRSRFSLHATRGQLLDREGKALATTEVRYRLFVDPKLIDDVTTFSTQMRDHFGYDPAEISRRLFDRYDRRYVVLDEHMSEQRIETLKHLNWRCLGKQFHMHRSYPQGELAGQVIGVVGNDGHGLEGIELRLDGALVGEAGSVSYLRDAGRNPLLLASTDLRRPAHGRDVQLSLDVNIQLIAEKQLEAACEQYEARRGQVIVMNPHTGEILAMANYPKFNPNNVAQSTAEQRRNACVTDVFEPGSIMKAVVWSLLTDARRSWLSERIDCESGAWRTGFSRTLHDAHGHGLLTWAEVLIKSSNIGMGKVAMRARHAWLREKMLQFGFGSPTGSSLPGEVGGIVTSRRDWSNYTQTSVPMGQEIAVTPLQMTSAFATISNGGLVLPPTILSQRDAVDAYMHVSYPRVISERTSLITRQVLRRVVTEGTARTRVGESPYEIFGKTGTAQVPDRVRGGYKERGYVGSFVGGAPVIQPRIVVGCFIHEPNPDKGYYGGVVAAPVVREVIEQTMAYLGAEPEDR